MSRSEDYLDDLLNSVSGINKKDNKKDIEGLLQSMEDEQERAAERRKEKKVRRRDYGEQFAREFEQEVMRGMSDDATRDFEMELDLEKADIAEAEEEKKQQDPQNDDLSLGQQEPSEQPDVNEILGEVRKKVEQEDASQSGDAMVDDLEVDTMGMVGENTEEPVLLNEESFDGDLVDMLTASGDADLADIGGMLKADENGDLDTTQLFGDTDELDELLDKEGQKSDIERLESIDELKNLKDTKKKDKKGFFSKLAAIFFGEEEEDVIKVDEEDSLGSLSDENADILRALDGEEKKEKKKKDKKEKKGKKEKKEKEPKPKKEKVKKPPKPKKEKEKDTTPPLPKKPVILILAMAASILVLIMLGSNNLQYTEDVQNAKQELRSGDYISAYSRMAGSSIRKKDQNVYDKALLLASVQYEYRAYESLMSAGQFHMGADALVRALGRCDEQIELAEECDASEELSELRARIVTALGETFGITEAQAQSLNQIRERESYTVELNQILGNLRLE